MPTKRRSSPATELLRSRGLTNARLARETDRHPNAISHILSGTKPWTNWFNLALIEVTKDTGLVDEAHDLANKSRLNFLSRELSEFKATL